MKDVQELPLSKLELERQTQKRQAQVSYDLTEVSGVH